MTTHQSPASEAAVVFRDVVKVYHPDVRALDHVCFDIHRGETIALLGPNGAGKSTAIDIMLGLRTQSSGEARVLGGTPAAAVAAGNIGGMLQTSGLPEAAKVGELVGARNRAEAVQIAEREGLALTPSRPPGPGRGRAEIHQVSDHWRSWELPVASALAPPAAAQS